MFTYLRAAVKTLRDFNKSESGATAIEYGLIAALISVAALTALSSVGTALTDMFNFVSSELDSAVSSAKNT